MTTNTLKAVREVHAVAPSRIIHVWVNGTLFKTYRESVYGGLDQRGFEDMFTEEYLNLASCLGVHVDKIDCLQAQSSIPHHHYILKHVRNGERSSHGPGNQKYRVFELWIDGERYAKWVENTPQTFYHSGIYFDTWMGEHITHLRKFFPGSLTHELLKDG